MTSSDAFLTWRPLPGQPHAHLVLFRRTSEATLHLKGKLRVRALSGALECLGHEVAAGADDVDVFSPRGHSLLGLRATAGSDARGRKELRGRLRLLGFDDGEADAVCREAAAAAPSAAVAVLSRHSGLDGLGAGLFGRDTSLPGRLSLPSEFPELERALDANLFVGEAVAGLRYFRVIPQWRHLVSSAMQAVKENGQARLLLMGGKGVGKSSLSKFLANQLLPRASAVLYLDLDPGQGEFSLPGCVSACVIKNPVLGPNFCHVSKTEQLSSVFVGDVNASNVRQRYLLAVRHLVERSQQALAGVTGAVWIVNTMGFNRGVGLHLLRESAVAAAPTCLVSIESGHRSKNYPPAFKEELSRACGVGVGCGVVRLPAVPEAAESAMAAGDAWGSPHPRALRDLVLRAHFSAGRQTTAAVSWDDVYLQSAVPGAPESHVLRQINGNMVALCRSAAPSDAAAARTLGNGVRLLDRLWPCECAGFALVRGVDLARREIVVTSTLSLDELASVDCLAVGAVVAPPGCLRGMNLSERAEATARDFPRSPLAQPWQKSSRAKANFQA